MALVTPGDDQELRGIFMIKRIKMAMVFVAGMLAVSSAGAQDAQVQHERRPAASTVVDSATPKRPTYQFFSILNGQPKGLELHHDTQVNTGTPVDVYVFAIELQVMNSDGDLEPEGLIIDNFYTAKAVEPQNAPNPHNARDCGFWNSLILEEIPHDPEGRTWSYVEFTVAQGARMIQTNEDGAVWWSDDVECWGARDRFSPF
jgi:hypothetical protein